MKATRFLTMLTMAAVATPAMAQVHITGAGSSFSNIIYTEWMKDYMASHSGVQLNYQSIGSGAGIKQFTAGTINFGASDAPMSDAQIKAVNGNVIHIPTEMGGVLPTYNLKGIKGTLQFTPDVLADIYLGKITKWNDPRLVAINRSAGLPNEDIAVVHRSDASGTSFIFTDYLTKVSPSWAQRVGRGTSVNWPTGIGGKGNEGVSAAVSQTPGAIGYVELGYALINHLPVAAVRNKAGHFIKPTIASVTAAAAGAMKTMGPSTDFRVSITNADGAASYPISSFTWMLVHKEYQNRALASALVRYAWWTLTDGQAKCGPLGYAPIPKQMQPWIKARLKSVTVGGQPVWTGGSASR